TVNAALGFEAGAVIVAVAIMLDRMLRVEAKQ
ncbi:MAG: choline ABC transporter permease subunit, partial [Alphaproteobacteria bacterium]|nr:choline ABC transporter permease subunit [Alphaproteobacteria bacterium]